MDAMRFWISDVPTEGISNVYSKKKKLKDTIKHDEDESSTYDLIEIENFIINYS